MTRNLRGALTVADHPSTSQPESLAVVRRLAFVSTSQLVPARIEWLPEWSDKKLRELVEQIEGWEAAEYSNEATVDLVREIRHHAQHRDPSDATTEMLWPAARLLGNGYPYDANNPQNANAKPRPTTMPKAVADFLTVCHRASLTDQVIGERGVQAAIEAINKIPD